MEDDEQIEGIEDLPFIFISEINHLAALYYQHNGRKYMNGFEFQLSGHPEEVDCWNKAIIAYAVINKDSSLLCCQVNARDNMLF